MRIWLTASELKSLPMSGIAWSDVQAAAKSGWGTADIHDSDYVHNIGTLAGALYSARSGDAQIKSKTQAALKAIIGTEVGPQEGGQQPGLAVSRKLASYVIAADLIDYTDSAFKSWLSALRTKKLSDGNSIVSIHERRGNNWGTMAGASRVAADLYLGDQTDLGKATKVHRGWLGDRSQYAGFDWGSLDWQANKAAPVGINKKGATLQINGAPRNVDGVQPDDQRRTGFQWPPAKGNYPWGALGPALVTTELLRHTGTEARLWSDSAPLRAARWLYDVNANPPDGDDGWQPALLSFLYPAYNFAGAALARGKNMAFTQWTHATRSASAQPPSQPMPEPPPLVDPCADQRARLDKAKAELSAAQKAYDACKAANP